MPLPKRIATAPVRDAPGVGYVVADLERGALILRGPGGKLYRPSWNEAGDDAYEADRRRALPVGEYRLVGYRIIREAEDGSNWHVSATAKTIRRVSIKPGKVQKVPIDPTIQIGQRLGSKSVSVKVRGERGAGLSIYKNGKRIPIGYRLLDAGGRQRFAGPIKYG